MDAGVELERVRKEACRDLQSLEDDFIKLHEKCQSDVIEVRQDGKTFTNDGDYNPWLITIISVQYH